MQVSLLDPIECQRHTCFIEIARILRPSGRFCVCDLGMDDDRPPEVMSSGGRGPVHRRGSFRATLADKLGWAGLVDIDLDEGARRASTT